MPIVKTIVDELEREAGVTARVLERVPQEKMDWPLDTPLSSFGEPLGNDPKTRCGVVSGAEFDELYAAAQSANQLTPWVSEGTRYGLILRPLLPDEHAC